MKGQIVFNRASTAYAGLIVDQKQHALYRNSLVKQ